MSRAAALCVCRLGVMRWLGRPRGWDGDGDGRGGWLTGRVGSVRAMAWTEFAVGGTAAARRKERGSWLDEADLFTSVPPLVPVPVAVAQFHGGSA